MSAPGLIGRAGNLPAELTTFVGRVADLVSVRAALERTRLVTLVGPGGVGKTRLALRAAGQAAGAFADGVWLVELSSLADPSLLPGRVGQCLRLQDRTARSDTDALVDYLAGRDMLLVLDTCEHLVDSCAILVEVLLRAAPGLRVLTTTRQPLGIPGEHVLPVAPLPLPTADVDPDDIPANALALFAERAVAADPSFTLTPENVAAAVRLCRRLDGIPLAIELAAVRLCALSVTQLADRLDDRLRMLGRRAATSDLRHHTLQASIQWSHELCTAEERLLWARLSVFAGGFDLDAAEHVCDGDETFPHGVLEPLVALVEKSIVLREETRRGPRFRMLDTLREFGTARLRESGQADAAVRRHRDHYLALSRRFAAEWDDGDQIAWCDRLRSEYADVTAALGWCLDDPAEHRAGLEMVGGLGFFWIATGHIKPGRNLLETFLSLCPGPTPERARALWTTAWICCVQADLPSAERAVTEGLRIADELDDPRLRAWCLCAASFRAAAADDLEAAVELGERAVEAFRDVEDPVVGPCSARMMQSFPLAYLGRVAEATAVMTRARDLAAARGEVWARSYADFVLGVAELRRGDLAASAAHSRAALEARHRMGDQAAVAATLEVLAGAAAKGGDGPRAARLLGAAHGLWLRVGALDGQGPMGRARTACVARTRSLLGDTAFAAAFVRGERLTLDEAVADALGFRNAHTGRASSRPWR